MSDFTDPLLHADYRGRGAFWLGMTTVFALGIVLGLAIAAVVWKVLA